MFVFSNAAALFLYGVQSSATEILLVAAFNFSSQIFLSEVNVLTWVCKLTIVLFNSATCASS
jgi:hypothetical protein